MASPEERHITLPVPQWNQETACELVPFCTGRIISLQLLEPPVDEGWPSPASILHRQAPVGPPCSGKLHQACSGGGNSVRFPGGSTKGKPAGPRRRLFRSTLRGHSGGTIGSKHKGSYTNGQGTACFLPYYLSPSQGLLMHLQDCSDQDSGEATASCQYFLFPEKKGLRL